MTTRPQGILRVKDLAVATSFYLDRLGFAVEELTPGVVEVRGPRGARLLLAAPHADVGVWTESKLVAPGAWVYLGCPEVAAVVADLRGRAGVQVARPTDPHPGMRRAFVADPDGYILVFWETTPLTDAEILHIYATGPDRLRSALHGADLDRSWGPGKWTARQVVHHLVDSDLSTFQTLRWALAHSGRVIAPDIWEPDDWATRLDYAGRPVGPAVDALAATRALVMELIAHLPGSLDREVAWPSGYRATVRDLLRQIGSHLLHHLEQINP